MSTFAMKTLHRPTLFAWSQFDAPRNIDFNSFVWIHPDGNIVFDPLPLSEHDHRHLSQLGGIRWIVLTNSDHVRDALPIQKQFAAQIAGPMAEKESFPIVCQRWLQEGDELVPGLKTFELSGSKTPGELAFNVENHTLIVGDLIRCHQAGSLCLLPETKLQDAHLASQSVQRITATAEYEAVLVGDGYPVFRNGHLCLKEIFE
jgi:hypothetical protein